METTAMRGAKGFLRGHAIVFDEGADEWIYANTMEPTVGSDRSCGHCNKPNRLDGHDSCLGHLHGVSNACCGHGQDNEAYVVLNGIHYASYMALNLIDQIQNEKDQSKD